MVSSRAFRNCVSIDRIRSHIEALEGVRHPVTAPEALERAAGYVAEQFRLLGYDVADHLVTYGGREFPNVIAYRRGLRLGDEHVFLLAHYDTVENSPGADDNASGVAVLLEVAALLAQLRFERTVNFVGVTLEENETETTPDSGTRGSRALAEYARRHGWQIGGVVVLESVAFAGDTVIQTAPPGIPFAVPDVGDFIAVVGNERSKELVEGFSRAVERERLDLPTITLVVPGNGELLPDTRRSDHAPFWDAGCRAIMLTDTTNFRNPHYHRATDNVETLNLDFAAKVAAATAALIAELASLD